MKLAAMGLSIGVAMCALTAPSTAATVANKPGINKVEKREQARIRQGIRSGELTRAEAARLEAEQARIRVYERYNRMDGGKLTQKERAQLNRQLHQASRHIYQQKHDSQDR